MKPYQYGNAGLAQVAHALSPREQRPRRWPAIALFAVFLAIFCRADSLRGFATAAPNPAARSNEMDLRMAGAAAAMMVAAAASAQYAKEWPVTAGGNGHWYVAVSVPQGITWTNARAQAESMSGMLACLESPSEKAFCIQSFTEAVVPTAWTMQGSAGPRVFGPWLGGYQVEGAAEPSSGWFWLSGSSFNPSAQVECCNNSCLGSSNENRLHLFFSPTQELYGWNDLPDNVTCGGNPKGLLVEFDADCNSDGIVDFGQIRDGSLADANANNIPDCCENSTVCGCPADIVQDGAVNGVDLAAVINAWGTDGGKLPRSDVNHDGIVNGADLAQVLGSWGACP